MRSTGRVFFVIFYIWATVTVAGERSALAVDRFAHSGGPAADQVSSPCHRSAEELPNFGHAKKVKSNVADITPGFSTTWQVVIRQFEELPEVEYSSSHLYKVHSSRAPPALI